MTTVRIVDGARYGFKFVGLVFGLLVISGVLFTLGGLLATGGELTPALAFGEPLMLAGGGFFGLAGVVVLYAGTVGLFHKLIADSVTAGYENAEGADPSSTVTDVEAAPGDSESPRESASDAEPETTFDRDDRRDEPIAADSPSPSEPTATAVESPAEPTESVTEKVEPDAVDLVENPTKKPGQAEPSTEPTADAPADDVTDPVAESAGGVDQRESAADPDATPHDAPAGDEDIEDEQTAPEGGRPTPEDIDRAVNEATERGYGGGSIGKAAETATDEAALDETRDQDDAVSTAEEAAEEVADADDGPVDDVFTQAEGEPGDDEASAESAKADVIDRAFEAEAEADLDDDHTIIDEAIDDGEVEHTTDEPGDWEPLDESDLKD